MTDAGLAESDLRDAFNSSWRSDLNRWATNWPDISKESDLNRDKLVLKPSSSDHFIQVHSLNLRIILLSVSLRFDGPTDEVLQECKTEAARTLRVVTDWLEVDHSILYASNYVVVDISCVALQSREEGCLTVCDASTGILHSYF
jgi:hypothetical protein